MTDNQATTSTESRESDDGFGFISQSQASTSQLSYVATAGPISGESFLQKKEMLYFIMAHKRELVVGDDHLHEEQWMQLTVILNSIEGAVKTCKEWKEFWKLWCATCRNRDNDLSITLLDLRLTTFLKSTENQDQNLTALKGFINGTSLLKASNLLSIINVVPQLGEKEWLVKLIHELEYCEKMFEAYQTKVEFNTIQLSDLIINKQEVEKNIDATEITLQNNQEDAISCDIEKDKLLKKIKQCIKLLLNGPTS